MKILHLPHNVGSKISITVNALRKIGMDARGVSINNFFHRGNNGIIEINPMEYEYYHPKKYMKFLEANLCLMKEIFRADIIHWYFDYRIFKTDFFLRLVKFLNKPAVIEWAGSEIRIPETLSKHNPYYSKCFSDKYEYPESSGNSLTVQMKFKNAGFEPLARPELEEFIDTQIFPDYYPINNRINVSDITPVFPSPENKNVSIVHPVTARNVKGTQFIVEAIEKLKRKYTFDFFLLEGIPRQQVLEKIKQADIVIDQLILGAFGTVSLEAMAYGKPVVCYISDNLKKKLPADNPIVNASPGNICEILDTLLSSSGLRNSTGMKSREYVQKHHDAETIAYQLVNIYKEVLKKKKVQ